MKKRQIDLKSPFLRNNFLLLVLMKTYSVQWAITIDLQDFYNFDLID